MARPQRLAATAASVVVAWTCCLAMALGSEAAGSQGPATPQQEVVVATVDGQLILAAEVERLVQRAQEVQEIDASALPALRAGLLAEVVDRRLVLAYAERTKSGPTTEEVDEAVAKSEATLKRQDRSLDDYLKQQSLSVAEMRRQITWDLAWPRYVARYATEARLRSYFTAHRRDFDGTRVSVSHILLRPAAGAGPEATAGLIERAEAIRSEIVSGKLSFADAAAKYSMGPSADEGGRLGPIGRDGPMVEEFSRAAFALEEGQMSQPVATPFGVHLIRCDAIERGERTWNEVREQLEEALARELLERLARHQEGFSRVEYTGKGPYFKPGTRELVVP